VFAAVLVFAEAAFAATAPASALASAPPPASASGVPPETPAEFKYSLRAEDFAKVFKSVESLSYPGWEATASKVVDINDLTVDATNERMSLLKEFRCNEYVSKAYANSQNKVTLELCRFDSPAGAYGAYTCFREGASTVIRRGDGSSEDDDGISFWQDQYLVLLRTSNIPDDECKNIMRKVADQIARNIENHAGSPAVLSELPFMDRISGSERVFMGPLAAHKFSPVHLTSDLMLDRCIIGATADYQIAEPFLERLKIMLIDYKDAATAYAALQELISTVCPSCGVPRTDGPTIFKLSGRFAWCEVRGNKLGVISNGRKAISVAVVGHQFNW
jgi:hypothetical protein